MNSSFSRFFRPQIFRLAAIALVVLAWSSGCASKWAELPALRAEIHDAAKSGDLEKVNALLKGNPDLVSNKNDDGDTPLHLAAKFGHKDMAELLLAHGADVNAMRIEPPPPNLAGSWLRAITEFSSCTPLHMAAAYGHKEVAELLLAHGADINAKGELGLTPLHLAAEFGYKDMVELLLAHGADVNDARSGETPMHMAVRIDCNDIAELLRQHGGHE